MSQHMLAENNTALFGVNWHQCAKSGSKRTGVGGMFAKGAKRKRNPSISDSSFDAVDYGDNIYTLHTNNNNRSSAQDNTTFDEHIYVDNPPKNDKRFKKKTLAAILYLAFSVNVLIILLLVPNRFNSELASAIPVTLLNFIQNLSKYSSTDKVEQPLEIQLKNMALNVMQSNEWSTEKLERIDMSWQSFSTDQQNKIKQEVWFQLFENAIIHELDTLNNNAKTPTKMPPEVFAITTMAKSLGIREIPEYKLAKVDKDKSIKTASRNTHATAAIKKIKATPVSTQKTNGTNLVKAKSKNQNQKNSKPPIQKKKLKPQTKTVTVKPSDGPTLSELSDITVQFEDSYEEGNLEKLMSLFSMKAISNRFNNVNEIEQQYADLFRSTSERQIFIHDMKWTYSKGKAVGKGKMETVLMTDTDSKVRSSNSRVQLVVEKLGETTRITRFYALKR